jgi:hypothetical protein
MKSARTPSPDALDHAIKKRTILLGFLQASDDVDSALAKLPSLHFSISLEI